MDADEPKDERRRQQSKMNQRAYQRKKKGSEEQLENDVLELARANDRLSSHILVLQRGLWCHAEHQAIVEFYRLFAGGYDKSPRQKTFLRYFVYRDVWFNGLTGVETFLAPWEQYATLFTSNHVECKHIADVSSSSEEVIVHAEIVATLHFGMQTIETLFPIAKTQHEFTAALRGWNLELPIRVMYTFDDAKTVKRVNVETDLIPALLRQLGNLDSVLAVLALAGENRESMQFPALGP
ncbi:hypothetical protein AeMF1_000805 [Aphanomyces euteiches]|nr:hypothetical protein AeMF1_000805 [Aphanomyces euteiches]KAH9194139.1 hypothetical protein AeNC1_003871 [Aphanomyces euteiches]